MQRVGVGQGLWVGVIAAAATLGMLFGFGRAHGSTFLPLDAIARPFFGSRVLLIDRFDPVVTAVALVTHVVSVVLWSILFVLLTGRLRGLALGAAAAAYAAVVFLIDQRLLSRQLAPGFERALSGAETIMVYVVLAVALGAGSSVARRIPRRTPDSPRSATPVSLD